MNKQDKNIEKAIKRIVKRKRKEMKRGYKT